MLKTARKFVKGQPISSAAFGAFFKDGGTRLTTLSSDDVNQFQKSYKLIGTFFSLLGQPYRLIVYDSLTRKRWVVKQQA